VEQAVAEARKKMQLQLKDLPLNPTSGSPMEQQQQRKERQRARKVNDALLQMAIEQGWRCMRIIPRPPA
jgi:hypothetical protein